MLSKKMYYELAVDGEEVDNPVDENPQEETAVEPETNPAESSLPSEFDIDGEKVTLEQIKEFKKGYMRQSDYTRKTQELSNQRKDTQDAIELYTYLQAHPEITKKLAELDPDGAKPVSEKTDPTLKMVEQLNSRLTILDLEKQLDKVLSTDKDGVTEIELLNIAQENKCDINMAYNTWKANNFDKILEKRLKEQKKELKAEIQKNSTITKTLINPGDKPNNVDYGLTDTEKTMAGKLGMTEEEYSKWKS